jgi:DNA-binding beta-propeller fold protein YncE
MKNLCATFLTLLLAATLQVAFGGEAKFSSGPTASKAGGKTVISFTLSANTDVEVAILDSKGKVVCHLAAGVLGAKTPPSAPLKSGLSQKLEWDGKDDFGQAAKGGSFKVRVRAGMGVKLEKIVGGDPYAFYSQQSGQGDHFQWKMAGVEAKSDGKVYVMGNTTFYGAQVIRQYDAVGNYIKTVFPPPAGKPLEEVRGWGVNVRADGSFTLRNGNNWQSSCMGNTPIAVNYGKLVADLVATPKKDKLALRIGSRFIETDTNGTLKACNPRPFFGGATMPKRGLRGPCYTALSPDKKHLYVSGPHSCRLMERHVRVLSVDTTGFWRDGQVWKMDLATRKMTVFFALDEKKVIGNVKTRAGTIGDHNYISPASAFHGVAVDPQGRVFVCDRQNKRIAVLDQKGKLLRELPVKYPDAVGVSPKSKAVYVTTRHGDYSGRGKLTLLKFNDWSKDTAPAVTLPLRDGIGKFPQESTMTVVEHKGQVMVWVVYTTLPVRIYRDTGRGLELVKDFYQAGPQRALDLKHMQVDQKTEDVYIADTAGWCFRITDWQNPKFELCMEGASKKRLAASTIALDSRNRYLYAQCHHSQPTRRYNLGGKLLTPAPVGSSGNVVTGRLLYGWGFSGLRPRGMAASPEGGLATLGTVIGGANKGNDYNGHLYYWKPGKGKAPWESMYISNLGKKPNAGGIRFDLRGNLYVGINNGHVKTPPPGYAKDSTYRRVTARIYKYAPTGSLKSGALFTSAPSAPAKVYDVHFSPMPRAYHTPRFGVDGWGRLYYPNGVRSRVSVIDNQGNQILSFGTWGNRDSMGGLKGDLVPTKDVPMACPNSVDATDDYIYVSDMNNIRLLRLAKTFSAEKTVQIGN